MIQLSNRTKGIIALFLMSMIWASFGIFIRILSHDFSIFQQLYVRLFAAFFLALAIFWKDLKLGRLLHIPKRDWIVLVVRVVCFYLLGSAINAGAFLSTTYSNVTFLGAIPTTAVLGIIFFQEKITAKKILFIALACLGVFLITITDYTHAFIWGRGDILALIADFFFSLSYIARKWHTNYLNNKELTVVMLFLASICISGISFLHGEGLPLHSNQIQFMYLVVILGGALLNIASIFLNNFGFQYVETLLANNIIAFESVAAVAFGFFLFSEIPTLQSLIGGGLILASVFFLNKQEVKTK